jgi:antirestriction protein ArdC
MTKTSKTASNQTTADATKQSLEQRFAEIAKKIESLFYSGNWTMPFGAAKPHHNHLTGKRYNGINAMILSMIADEQGFASREWLTFKQLQSKGYLIKKGSKGSPVQFWSTLDKEKSKSRDTPKSIATKSDNTEGKEDKDIWFVRYYTVFNLSQCTDMDGNELVESTVTVLPDLEEQQNICYTIAERMDVTIQHRSESGQAYYSPSQNLISLPMPTEFHTQEGYINTLLHELGHATHRHVRPTWKKGPFGSVLYAKEEVVAELTAVLTASMFGVEKQPLDSHASYIKGWLDAAKDETKTFFNTALKEATKAAYFMWDIMYPETKISTVEADLNPEPADPVSNPLDTVKKPKTTKAKTTVPKTTKKTKATKPKSDQVKIEPTA